VELFPAALSGGCEVRRKIFVRITGDRYGAPFVKILYLTDLAQKLISLRALSYFCVYLAISARYLCAHLAISAQI